MAWQTVSARNASGTTIYIAGSGAAGTIAANPIIPVHAVMHDSSNMANGATTVTPAFGTIDVATSGDQTIVAAVASTKRRVLGLWMMAAGTVSIYFKTSSGAVIFGGSTNKIAMVAQTPVILPFSPVGWFETVSGDGLVMNLSASVAVSGGLIHLGIA